MLIHGLTEPKVDYNLWVDDESPVSSIDHYNNFNRSSKVTLELTCFLTSDISYEKLLARLKNKTVFLNLTYIKASTKE